MLLLNNKKTNLLVFFFELEKNVESQRKGERKRKREREREKEREIG